MPLRFAPLALLVIALLAGCRQDAADPGTRLAAAPAAQPGAFRAVVEQALPTIVFIQAEAAPPPGLEQLLPELRGLGDAPLPIGVGSGVLFRADGYILTNNHVVQDAERVMVVLHDRRYFEAEVVGRDPSTEVAVVRIPGNGFPVARLADSDAVGIGDWVLAMGSPLGLEFSVTAGIVSGTGRALGIVGTQPDRNAGTAAPLEHFIQTDAALSPGNSGGPLMNTAGEVVGINTAVAAQGGVPGAFGFAIPSNLARHVAEQLIETGVVRRPYLGVALATVSPRLAEEQGLATVAGAAVVRVEGGGPADRAGVRPDDVILRIAEHDVLTVSDLQARLAALDPGTSVDLRVYRDGRETTVTVELDEVRSGAVPG